MTENRTIDFDSFRLEPIPNSPEKESENKAVPDADRRATGVTPVTAHRKGYRVNYWFLAGLVLVLAVVAPSLHFWRNYQVQRNARVLISRAEAKGAEGDWRGAAETYHRYLQLVPDDRDILIERTRAFDKSAVSPDRANRAIALLFQAVDADPDDVSLRMRLSQRLFDQQRWSAARDEALRVLEREPEHHEASRLSVLALRAQFGPSRAVPLRDVVDAHVAALRLHPGDPVLSVSLAELYRDHQTTFPDHTPEQVAVLADRIMGQMIAARPDDEEARLARYRYSRTYNLAGAEADLEKCLELAPDRPEVLAVAAAAFLDSEPQRSLELARRLLAVEPEQPRSHQLLAEVLARTGQVDEAIEALNQALAQFGQDNYLLQWMLLSVALDDQRIELANEAWKQIGRWLERFSPYMPHVNRRRLNEDHQLSRARILLLEKRVDDAIKLIRPLTTSVAEGGDADENLARREQRWRMLAEAYGQLQQWDLAAEAMAEAARLRPTGYESLLAESAMVRRTGDLDRAVTLLQEAASKPQAPDSVWLLLAEALIEQEFGRSAGQTRDWRRVRSVIERIRPELEGTSAFVSLQARWALADGRADDALDELRKILPVDDVPIDAVGGLAMLFDAAGDAETADALVHRLLADSRRAPQGEAARVELMVRRRDYDGARQRLDQLASADLESEQRELLPLLLGLQLEGGYVHEVRQRLERFRDQGPKTVPLLELGALVAVKAREWSELAKYVTVLERLEGQNGTVWRFYEILASVDSGRDGNGLDLSRARRLIRELEELRPQWPSLLVAKGRLAEQQGKDEEAVEHYQEAVRQGARGLLLMDWLVAGLYRQNRFAEAASYLRSMGPLAGMSSQFTELALPAYIRQGRLEDAVRLAKMSAELHPSEPLWQLLYAQALSLQGEEAEAEKSFRRAIELAPSDLRTWAGMLWFHARSQRADMVRQILSDEESLAKLNNVDRLLLAARGLGAIGDRMGATLRYQDVLEARPDDPTILEEVARFHLQGNMTRSLELYRKLLTLSPNSMTARRSIALIMGLRGNDEGREEALQILRERDPATSSPLDERLEIVLLMGGDEQQRSEAVSRLTDLVASADPVPVSDRLLLARALEIAGRQDEARLQYQPLLTSDAVADVIAIYASFLLRCDEYDEADTWLTRLEEKAPTGVSLVTLRAEWLAACERSDEIVPLVEHYVNQQRAMGSEQLVAALRQSRALLARYDLGEFVEPMLRTAAGESGAVAQLFVSFLVDEDRLGDAAQAALDSAVKFGEEQPPIPLIQVMTLLAARRIPDSALQAQAEQQLERVRAHHADDVRFLFDLGTLRVMQDRNDDAVDLYEASLNLRPDYLPSLNNLAIVLSEIPERREEAVAMVQRLVAMAPDSAEVKDSHAMVLIGCERFEEALEILESMLDTSPENARLHFHAATVRDRLGNADAARKAFHQAWSHGLEKELLTPTEHGFVERLSRRYGRPTVPPSTISEEDDQP